MERANIGMVQCGNRVGLALEAIAKLLPGNFDRHIAAEPRIACAINFTHSTGSDEAQDFVRPELVTCSERHISSSAKFSGSKKRIGNRRRPIRKLLVQPYRTASRPRKLRTRTSSPHWSVMEEVP